MKRKIEILLSGVIRFCPKTGRPVKSLKRWTIPIFGILSLLWILIRVLPKPQRAAYPCMKVALPMASSLIIYLGCLASSFVFFKRAYGKFADSRYGVAVMLLFIGIAFTLTSIVVNKTDLFAGESAVAEFSDPLGPNVPIGEAKGILPGRVVWIHNPEATNEDCVPWNYGDGYFLDKNCDQALVDEMLVSGILEVTGKETEESAWEAIFKSFNSTHNKGEFGYSDGEKIFIKINAVHAGSTNEDLSIRFDDDYGKVDTSPQVILAVLRQLIHKAGVPEEAIYIGDPFTNIFKHLYEKLSAEFPEIHYMSRGDYDHREQLTHTNTEEIRFSDKGMVLEVETDQFYDCTINADYVLSLPAMKCHRVGGVTFFAKNHFGTNVQSTAKHLHKGLHKGSGFSMRGEYRMYRVFVDLMSYEHLGGKNLIYIGDFLWGTSMEHDPPVKFRSAPFNDDYTSSILVSMDPVAIASVGLDIMQEEFQVEDLTVYPPRWIHVHFPAVDDYLHQAASSDWWPDGIIYDPEDDGTPIGSLGVHEHWNNAEEKQYSRNLKTGEGIELIYQNIQNATTSSINHPDSDGVWFKAYPSSGNERLVLVFNQELQKEVIVSLYAISGRLVQQHILTNVNHAIPIEMPLNNQETGYYVVKVQSGNKIMSQGIILP